MSALISLGDLPALYASRQPENPCLTFGGTTLSWRAFAERCEWRARRLAESGVSEGDTVSIILPNGFSFYETTFAIWKLGAIPNPVSLNAPQLERDAVLRLAAPKVIEVQNATADAQGNSALDADSRPPVFPGNGIPGKVAPFWKVICSGGSTGRPKLIVDHMPGIWEMGTEVLGMRPGDTVLNPGPLYHNAPFTFAHVALFGGGHLVEGGKFDPEMALALLARHRVAWVCLVPTMMSRISRLHASVRARYDLSSLRRVIHMAAPCPAWLKEFWIEWLGPERVYELYGGTERQGTTVISGSEWLTHRGSVGKVQSGSKLRILDAEGNVVGPGTVGEIHFLPDGGAGSTYHYIGDESRRNGTWESLGDLGYVDEEGYLYLVDRRIDLIISGGANIYPAEVEGAIEAHPAVAAAIVVGLADDDLGEVVHALVERAANEAAVTQRELIGFLRTRLSPNKIPRSFEFVPGPLRDDAGKARRTELREGVIRRRSAQLRDLPVRPTASKCSGTSD
jgi:bile acid-coenzyme A ligase